MTVGVGVGVEPHGPSVSPWRRCAGRASGDTMMVRSFPPNGSSNGPG